MVPASGRMKGDLTMAMLRISFVIDEDEVGDTIKSLRDIADTKQITITAADDDDDEPPARIDRRKVRGLFNGTAKTKVGKSGKRRRPPSPQQQQAGGKLAVERMVEMVRAKKDAGISPTELHQQMADAGFSRPTSYNSAFIAKKAKQIRRRVGDGYYVATAKAET